MDAIRKAIEALEFTVDPPGARARAIRWTNGSCRPASFAELQLWDALSALKALEAGSMNLNDTSGVNACPTCQGNDRDMPCAYPEGGQPGCLRDKRLGRTTACRGGSAALALARTGGLCGTCKAEGLTTPACASGVREDGNGRR